MTEQTTATGVSTHDMPDSALSCSAGQTKPCQILDGILQIEDEQAAQEVMKNIQSPLNMDLEESPSEEDDSVNATEEALPLGVPFSDFKKCIREINNKNPEGKENDKKFQELAYLSEELTKMDELFDTVRAKIGSEKFAGFLALFSLASRKSNEDEDKKGVWKVEINGKEIDAKTAEFSVDFKLKHDYQYIHSSHGFSHQMEGDNVFRQQSTFCNDKFSISVSPSFTRYSYEINEWDVTGPDFNKPDTISPTQEKTIDELADLLIAEIYDTIKLNNDVDWWTEKTLTAAEIILTAAVICTGVGGAFAVGARVLTRAIAIGMVVMESSNAIEAGSRFLGLNDKGYNPLLEACRYLDKNAGTGHAFQATFHGLNMVMSFGKKPVTRQLSALATGGSGAALSLLIENGGEQQKIQSYETGVPAQAEK